ncbi:uncharacterized protein LOC113349870 [Papaver somniferum]|uniref:uncharacterized protein LOC113349870 n=1 Tax=Papaver somniferum TaxID=3469 RepID=UPI000E6F8593|nr:uncharacterized protein LOC113349870 [Papaver somniferum]
MDRGQMTKTSQQHLQVQSSIQVKHHMGKYGGEDFSTVTKAKKIKKKNKKKYNNIQKENIVSSESSQPHALAGPMRRDKGRVLPTSWPTGNIITQNKQQTEEWRPKLLVATTSSDTSQILPQPMVGAVVEKQQNSIVQVNTTGQGLQEQRRVVFNEGFRSFLSQSNLSTDPSQYCRTESILYPFEKQRGLISHEGQTSEESQVTWP